MAEAWVTYLEKLQSQKPALTEDVEVLRDLHDRRLWHDLTLKLELFIEKTSWREDPKTLTNLFQYFISGIIYKLSPMRLAKIAVAVSKQYNHPQEASKNSSLVSLTVSKNHFLVVSMNHFLVVSMNHFLVFPYCQSRDYLFSLLGQ